MERDAVVGLNHCGLDALEHAGRRWEVPEDEEPFDGTNKPESFVGNGVVEPKGEDELSYTDESGVVLRFLPENPEEPPCA